MKLGSATTYGILTSKNKLPNGNIMMWFEQMNHIENAWNYIGVVVDSVGNIISDHHKRSIPRMPIR